jgi:dUTPase
VPKHGKCIVKTDLSIAIPVDTYARIAPRSGLAVKNFIDTGAGVVDYDYRGPVGELLLIQMLYLTSCTFLSFIYYGSRMKWPVF